MPNKYSNKNSRRLVSMRDIKWLGTQYRRLKGHMKNIKTYSLMRLLQGIYAWVTSILSMEFEQFLTKIKRNKYVMAQKAMGISDICSYCAPNGLNLKRLGKRYNEYGIFW